MTDLKWPAGLPDVIMLSGLSGRMKGNVLRTEMDAGPAKARQRYSVSTKTFSGKVLLTESQRAVLEQWYRNDTGNGTLRFVMKDPQTLRPAEFRFTDDYDEVSKDGLWEITLPLEKMTYAK